MVVNEGGEVDWAKFGQGLHEKVHVGRVVEVGAESIGEEVEVDAAGGGGGGWWEELAGGVGGGKGDVEAFGEEEFAQAKHGVYVAQGCKCNH